MIVTREDFQRWVEHPVTQWAFGALSIQAQEVKDTALSRVWNGGVVDEAALHRARCFATAFGMLVQPSYESMCEMHEQEPTEE